MAILKVTPQHVDQLERLATEITGQPWIKKSMRLIAQSNKHTTITTRSGEVFQRGTITGDRVTASRQACAYLLKIIDMHDKVTGQRLGDSILRAVADDVRTALMINQGSLLIEDARHIAHSDYTRWTKLTTKDNDPHTIWYKCGCAVCPEHVNHSHRA